MTNRYVVRSVAELPLNPHEGMRIYVMDEWDQHEYAQVVAMFKFRHDADDYAEKLNREEEAIASMNCRAIAYTVLTGEREQCDRWSAGKERCGWARNHSGTCSFESRPKSERTKWKCGACGETPEPGYACSCERGWQTKAMVAMATQHKDAIPPPAMVRNGVPMVRACPDCGSTELRAMDTHDGFICPSGHSRASSFWTNPPPAPRTMDELFGACADDDSSPNDEVFGKPDIVFKAALVKPQRTTDEMEQLRQHIERLAGPFVSAVDREWHVVPWEEKPQQPNEGERVRCCRAHCDPCWMLNDEVWKSLKERCDG